jgi:hypothetical protein
MLKRSEFSKRLDEASLEVVRKYHQEGDKRGFDWFHKSFVEAYKFGIIEEVGRFKKSHPTVLLVEIFARERRASEGPPVLRLDHLHLIEEAWEYFVETHKAN